MLDVQNAPASPAVIHREEYRPPDWQVPDLALDFDLDAAVTRVRATLSVVRSGAHDRPLRLEALGGHRGRGRRPVQERFFTGKSG